MKRRGAIQAYTETSRDAHGSPVGAWATVTTRWMSFEPLRGDELLHAQQQKSTVTHRIRMWYWSTLTTDHRITYDSRTFTIASILDVDEENREQVLLCSELT